MARAAEPGGPVGVARDGEFFTPTVEVEFDAHLAAFVGEGVERIVGDVRGGARVGIKVGLFGEIRGGGILFDVEQGLGILRGVGDVFGVEVIAPEVSFGALEAVHEAGMVALQVLHEAGDGAAAEGFEHEVDMVGHEAEGVDADVVTASEQVKAIEVEEEVFGFVERVLALGTSLVDVVGLAAFPFAKAGRIGLSMHV